MSTIRMATTTFKERLEEAEERVDTEQFLDALQYVRDDGRQYRR